jgi:D-alanyl-D-alanine carboxypeptidase
MRGRLVATLLALASLAMTMAAPPCGIAELITPLNPDTQPAWVLVDPSYRLPAGYAPGDLMPVSAAGFSGDFKLRAVVIDDLRALREAALAAGVRLAIQSAYRSEDYQRTVHAVWVERLGAERAALVSARAGHSEHQLGTALDLRSADGPPAWDLDDWAETPEGGWVARNAHTFGFVISYPRNGREASCYDYEPWHLRWVGRETAAAAEASGLAYRAWLYAHHPPHAGGNP